MGPDGVSAALRRVEPSCVGLACHVPTLNRYSDRSEARFSSVTDDLALQTYHSRAWSPALEMRPQGSNQRT